VPIILIVLGLALITGLTVKRPGLGSYLFLLASAGVVSLAYAYLYFRL
jgi:hypothetical protein